MPRKLNRQEVTNNFDEIKQAFIEQFNVTEENYDFSISAKCNFILQRKGRSSNDVYFIYIDEKKNYIFKNVANNPDILEGNVLADEIDSFRADFEEILKDLSDQYWFYLKNPTFISGILTQKKGYVINIRTSVGKDLPFKIAYKQYERQAKAKRKEWCLNRFKKEVENYINSSVGAVTRRELKAKIKNDIAKTDLYNSEFTQFASFIKKCPYKNLIFGNDKMAEINDIYQQIEKPSYEYRFNRKNKYFEIAYGPCIYSITPFEYKVIKKRKYDAFYDKASPIVKSINNAIPYYELISEFLKTIESCNCHFEPNGTKEFRQKNISKDWASSEIAVKNTALVVEHFENFFPLYISIPHIEDSTDMKQLKKETKTALNQLLKEVKATIQEIDKKIIEDKDHDLYRESFQSPAAKIIADFLKEQPYKVSFSHLYDRLKSGTDKAEYINDKNKEKYNGILKKYSKDDIKKYVYQLECLQIIRSKRIDGKYNYFDAYYYNSGNKYYNLYFSNIVRSDKEIINALKNNEHISQKEAERVLCLLNDEKIKEKDMDRIFSIFKLHEFVLLNEESIINSFSKIPKNVKLYIPFIIDEYPERGIERRVLNKIAKSK